MTTNQQVLAVVDLIYDDKAVMNGARASLSLRREDFHVSLSDQWGKMGRLEFQETAMKRMFAVAVAMVAVNCAHGATVCDVHKYGAKGDGTTKDTVAIQKAIDDCSTKKGTVKLAGGDFVSGPLI